MTQGSALVLDARRPVAGGYPALMRDMRTMHGVSELRLIESTELRRKLAEQVTKTYEDNAISIVAWYGRSEAVLMPMDLWNLGRQRRAVDEMMVERIGTRDGRDKLRTLTADLRRGRHTIMTVWREDRAAFAPYDWARAAFPEWGLPEVSHEPTNPRPSADCVQVVYRKSRSVQELLAEFTEAKDPQWEVDRRLSAGPRRIPVDRRAWLRGVVYVEDGVVVRVRALDPQGEWEDVSDKVSLAPVSAPLTREQIQEQLPALRMFPGERRPAPQGAPREYVDL